MNSLAEPESMTAEERRMEIANILACSVLRHIRSGKMAAAPPVKKTSKRLPKGLDLSLQTRLSVAP